METNSFRNKNKTDQPNVPRISHHVGHFFGKRGSKSRLLREQIHGSNVSRCCNISWLFHDWKKIHGCRSRTEHIMGLCRKIINQIHYFGREKEQKKKRKEKIPRTLQKLEEKTTVATKPRVLPPPRLKWLLIMHFKMVFWQFLIKSETGSSTEKRNNLNRPGQTNFLSPHKIYKENCEIKHSNS